MHTKAHSHGSIFATGWNPANVTRVIMLALLSLIFLLLFLTLTAEPLQGQTFSVIHNFTGGRDGADPWAGPTLDRAGNLYGTTFEGGSQNCGAGCGVVYKLAHHGSSWVLDPLYSFTGGGDGAYPTGAVTLGPDGTLFGTDWGETSATVFNLKPQPMACSTVLCPWAETVIYRPGEGSYPYSGLVFDSAGNLYGTTYEGGFGWGTVFEVTPSGGSWDGTPIYGFYGLGDGGYPSPSVALDSAGDLYGTTVFGGNNGLGTVFELTRSGSDWTKTILYSFQGQNDGQGPTGGVVFDGAGNLFGGTLAGGTGGRGGTVYELSHSNQGWKLTILHAFTFSGNGGIRSNLTIDGSGNIYGTTVGDGAYGQGSVFKLTPSGSGWSFTDLHDFTGGSDGGSPLGGVAVDARGNLYGTASQGGSYGQGVIWEITP